MRTASRPWVVSMVTRTCVGPVASVLGCVSVLLRSGSTQERGMSRVLVLDSAKPQREWAWQEAQALTDSICTVTLFLLTLVMVPGWVMFF